MTGPRFVPVSDCALMVEFGQEISGEVNRAVVALDKALHHQPPQGLSEVVPAFVNLLAVFDPLETDHAEMQTAILALLDLRITDDVQKSSHEVLVCYDPQLAPDLEMIAADTGLSPEAVINAHLGGDYRVFMYGFAPGYAYMAGVPDPLQLPRKSAAVRDVPAGSVIIAGPQCIVSTITMPTGWWRIGHSPTQILRNDPARPFLFDVGDTVTFKRIDRVEYETLSKGYAHV